MPFPIAYGLGLLIIALNGVISRAANAGYDALKEAVYDEIKKWLWANRKPLAIKAVKKYLGIDETDWTDLQEGDDFSLDEATITEAVNQKLGIKEKLGIEFSNILDREAIKADLNKLALARVNNILGAPESDPVITSFNQTSLRNDLRGFMGKQAIEAVGGGSSFLIDANGAERIVQAAMKFERNYAHYKPQEVKPEDLDMTPAGISNRERQARFRAKHTKHWEPR